MVSTRSGGSAQTKLEDFTDENNDIKKTDVKKRGLAAAADQKNKKVKVEQNEDQAANAEDGPAESVKEKESIAESKADDKDTDKNDKTDCKKTEGDDKTNHSQIKNEAEDKTITNNAGGTNEKPESSETQESKKQSTDNHSQETGDDQTSKDEPPVTTLKKSDDTDTHSAPIQINRAPVLTLFASCAAELQHPDLDWKTCLSIGNAVSSICAISKGRAIGVIGESASESSYKDQGERKTNVLGFDVVVRQGVAYVSDTKKPGNEGYLKSKFGARYDEVKQVMRDAVKTWKGNEEEFARKGFRMYEHFRPGGGGWGQQSGLYVEEVKRAIVR